jgi:putative CocE/NonD family hydrolase
MAETYSSQQNIFGQIDIGPAEFHGYTRQSQYIRVRDGTRLAVTLILPQGMTRESRLPAILIQTRYWRELELRIPFRWLIRPESLNPRTRGLIGFITGHGYAMVIIDERGTGASFGTWPYPWHDHILEDMHDTIDWVITQPWSNGLVGAYGVSYLGSTAELFGVVGHPSLRAVVPQFNHPDPYADVAFPGGLYNQRFIVSWNDYNRWLDQNDVVGSFGWRANLILRGVRPVDEDQDRSLLAAALAEHRANGSLKFEKLEISFRDELRPPMPVSIDGMSVKRYHEVLASSDVPVFGWGSWLDAGTGDAVLRRFLTYKNAQRAIVGAWDHGAQHHASPYQPVNSLPDPDLPQQWAVLLQFLDDHLKPHGNGAARERRIDYFVLGAETWKHSASFPPPGVQMQRWFFAENRQLSRIAPTVGAPGDPEAADTYTVDFAATTGLYNRWWELAALDQQSVQYPGRNGAEKHLLTYLSQPLEEDLEIAGYPVISLQLTSSHADGSFIVYLEDVDPDGSVRYLTEGELRAIQRHISQARQPYNLPIPYHTYQEADAQPLEPGQPAEITFGLFPVAALIRRGHRFRLGLAGHDADTFERYPNSGTPVWRVHRSSQRPSWIELPVVTHS